MILPLSGMLSPLGRSRVVAAIAEPSYLLSEDFDGEGVPNGWTFDGVGTCNFDDVGSISPQGGQQLLTLSNTNSASGGAQRPLGASYATLWMYVQCRWGNTGTINRATFFLNSCQLLFANGVGGQWGGSGGPACGITSNVWHHIWISATTSQQDIFVSTTGTRPVAPTASRTGTFAAATTLALNLGHSSAARFDKLRVSTSEIGSDPV
jgi:hypothetical protein